MKSWFWLLPILLCAGGAKTLDSGRTVIGFSLMLCGLAICLFLNAEEERRNASSRDEEAEDFIRSTIE